MSWTLIAADQLHLGRERRRARVSSPENPSVVPYFGILQRYKLVEPARHCGLAGHALSIKEDHIRTLLIFAFFAAFQAPSVDPRVGSWALVSAHSSMDPANRLTITSAPNGTHVVMSGQTHLDFTANTDGRQAPAPGNLGFNQIELHRIDRHAVEVREMKDSALIATVIEKLSKDGTELTSTMSASGHTPQITVWVRTGGTKNPKDPFAGEWTQDLSKTRMRQGSLVKVEIDGSGGVHFLGEYTYTARLDGKPYDLSNSRNDTVALQLVDPHIVDAISRRDNQVAQKDRWQVSPDGKLMTLTSTATLETGQHLTEQLLFKKQ